jgi:urease accessory protein
MHQLDTATFTHTTIPMKDKPMEKNQLFSLLQFAGGTFPTGAFSQSWGLETTVADGRVKTLEDFRKYLEAYIHGVLATFEGPALCHAYELTNSSGLADNQDLFKLEEQVTAMRLTRESREASHRTGKALIRIASGMLDRKDLTSYYHAMEQTGINYPVAFGLLAALLDVPKEEALAAFFFSAVNAMVQSAVKLIPLGNGEAQKLVFESYYLVGNAVETAIAIPVEEMYSFCPSFDLASIRHETLATRLYMS